MEDNLDQLNNDNKNHELEVSDLDSNIKKNLSKVNNEDAFESKTIPDEQKSKQIITENVGSSNINDAKKRDLNIKPKKEPPIEKKPFNEFVNDFLLPTITKELEDRGLYVENINLKNTIRPIAGDKCWVIYCEIRDTCNFWLSFEKEDITSLKSISLCRFNQKPSVIESFLIDEKRITLQLIVSRILQRLNGQKLLGIN